MHGRYLDPGRDGYIACAYIESEVVKPHMCLIYILAVFVAVLIPCYLYEEIRWSKNMVSLNCTTHWFVDAHAINCHLGIRSSGSVPVKIVSQVRCLQSFNGRLDGDGCAGKRRHYIPKSKNHWEGVASVPHSTGV